MALVTAWVGWTNATADGTRIVFPFLEAIVGPHPDDLAQATLAALIGVTAVSAGLAFGGWRRSSGGEEPPAA